MIATPDDVRPAVEPGETLLRHTVVPLDSHGTYLGLAVTDLAVHVLRCRSFQVRGNPFHYLRVPWHSIVTISKKHRSRVLPVLGGTLLAVPGLVFLLFGLTSLLDGGLRITSLSCTLLAIGGSLLFGSKNRFELRLSLPEDTIRLAVPSTTDPEIRSALEEAFSLLLETATAHGVRVDSNVGNA